MTNEQLEQRGFELQTVDGLDLVRIPTMPEVFKNRIGCSKKLDHSQIQTLFVCCQTYDEFIAKDHFLFIAEDLL